uniref:Uncharacterized protein n=1 Tax=Anguilla anguilla TaxID=7936 RepID=A0A0E9TW46_ANGAN
MSKSFRFTSNYKIYITSKFGIGEVSSN